MKKTREYLPKIADLIDALSIDQIKMVKIKRNRESYKKEITRICHDIDLIIKEKKNARLSAKIIRIVMTIALINLFIWNLKDQMRRNSENYDKLLKFAHQLNGIRNQMKNMILKEFGDIEPSLMRTNIDTEDLKDWDFKI